MPKETPVNFAKFSRTFFLQSNSGRLLLKYRHCKNEAKEIDCLCSREVDAMHIALAEMVEHLGGGGASCHPAFMGICRLLVTRVSFIYLVDEFFFWFLV